MLARGKAAIVFRVNAEILWGTLTRSGGRQIAAPTGNIGKSALKSQIFYVIIHFKFCSLVQPIVYTINKYKAKLHYTPWGNRRQNRRIFVKNTREVWFFRFTGN